MRRPAVAAYSPRVVSRPRPDSAGSSSRARPTRGMAVAPRWSPGWCACRRRRRRFRLSRDEKFTVRYSPRAGSNFSRATSRVEKRRDARRNWTSSSSPRARTPLHPQLIFPRFSRNRRGARSFCARFVPIFFFIWFTSARCSPSGTAVCHPCHPVLTATMMTRRDDTFDTRRADLIRSDCR